MYKNLLKNAGLTSVQAEIYEFLLNNGKFKVSLIAKKTKRPRGVVYKGLDELHDLGLVEKNDKPNQVSFFKAEHPSKLENLFEIKEKNIQKNRHTFDDVLPDLISQFNLTGNKPGIKFYEGEKGIFKALKRISDKFQPDSEIISFVKVLPEKHEKNMKQAFADFVKKRTRKNVKTRVIAFNTEAGKNLKENDDKNLRETKLASAEDMPLDFPGGELFVYENKFCTITVENGMNFAFIIENKAISQLLKAFFELQWKLLSPSPQDRD
ncbi:hypothetical protein KAU09_02500 [Candidatus Parcubacteria bacterium]|nr:hypothetical protein [Candidatus Parcubacteria bacterium]